MMSLQDRMGPVASISKLSTHITKPHLIIAKGVTTDPSLQVTQPYSKLCTSFLGRATSL